MKTKRRKRTDESESTAIFAKIPMEKLSDVDEVLWLEQVSSKRTDKAKKLKKLPQEESQNG